MAIFSHPDHGIHRLLAALLLFLCFAGWAVQLAGVAGLQAVCKDELASKLHNSDIHPLKDFLVNFQKTALALAKAGKPMDAATLSKTIQGMASGLSTLASRSAVTFTITPDTKCSAHYRYLWANTSLQLVPIVIMLIALVSANLATARGAIISLMAVSAVLDIENAHTLVYIKDLATDKTLEFGKVCGAGCVICAGAALAICIVLGIFNENIYRVSGSERELPIEGKPKAVPA